jgi:ribosomal protein S18 acetylase RimI-like enzyme
LKRRCIALAHLLPRPATPDDKHRILALYREVAARSGGIIREVSEITEEYVDNFIRSSLAEGIIFVVDDDTGDRLIGEIHSYRPGLNALSHILEHLTVVVHPSFQRKGIGRALFTALLDKVRSDHPESMRVELIAKESNHAALGLYRSLGFVEEGRMVKRIKRPDGSFEDDVLMVWMNPDYKQTYDPRTHKAST